MVDRVVYIIMVINGTCAVSKYMFLLPLPFGYEARLSAADH